MYKRTILFLLVNYIILPTYYVYANDIFHLGKPLFSDIVEVGESNIGSITAIALDLDGQVWIGAQQGLFRYDGYGIHFIDLNADNEHDVYVLDIWVSESNQLWVATVGFGLYRFDIASGETWNYRFNAEQLNSLSHDTVFSLAGDEHGLWMGTHVGLDYLDFANEKISRLEQLSDNVERLNDKHTRAVYLGTDGSLLVGSWSGLNRIDTKNHRVESLFSSVSDGPTLLDKCAQHIA